MSAGDPWGAALSAGDPWGNALSASAQNAPQGTPPAAPASGILNGLAADSGSAPVDISAPFRSLAAGAAHTVGDIAQSATNALQSTFGQRSIAHLLAGDGLQYAPTLRSDQSNLTARELANLARRTGLGGLALEPGGLPQNQVLDTSPLAMRDAQTGTPHYTDAAATRNGLRTLLAENVDPSWLIGGPAIRAALHGGGALARGAAAALDPALSAMRGTTAGQYLGAAGKQAADFLGVNAASKRLVGDARNAIWEQMSNRNQNQSLLEGLGQANTVESLRPELDLAMEKYKTAYASAQQLRAQHNILSVAEPSLDLSGPLQPIRDLLDREAWLNGTQKVRDKMQALGFAPHPDDAGAPLLNILTDYRQDYQPLRELGPETDPRLKGLYDDALGFRQRQPLSFNLPQQSLDADTPPADRILARLDQGRTLRTMVKTRRDILDDLGLLGRPIDNGPNATLLTALQGRGVNTTDELVKLHQAQAAHEAMVRQGLRDPGATFENIPDPFLGYVDPERNPFTSFANPDGSTYRGPLADAVGADKLSHAFTTEQQTFRMPAAVAQRLYQTKPTPSLLSNLADLKREALFMFPYGHDKNIGSMQLQGPGGKDALLRGFSYDEATLPQRAAALAEMGALALYGHGAAKTWIKDTPLAGWYQKANESLGAFDTNQRYALHEQLLENDPAYQAMSPLQRGARINDVLFNYAQASPLAHTLRQAGAAFPAWRLGNVTLQGRRLAENPGRQLAMLRGEQLLERSGDPDTNDPDAWSPRLNLPLDEAVKALAGDPHWLQGTAGPLLSGIGAYAGPQTAVGKVGDALKREASTLLPGGSEVFDSIGQSPYHSNAPGLLKAMLDPLGVSTRNNNPRQDALIDLQAQPGVSDAWARVLLSRGTHHHAF